MSIEWYDMIARKNGGYKSNAIFTVEGLSGESEFEKRLIYMLPDYHSVLDAGCGHGEFTLKVARYANSITGFDGSEELLKIAEDLRQRNDINNVRFIGASTKDELPFEDNQFDLIYNRRGPTSILNHSRILRSGGIVFGIHSRSLDKVKERLSNNGFVNVEIEIFDKAIIYFPNEVEFTKFITAIPGNPDYTLPENKLALKGKIEESKINGKLGLREWRYIWKAMIP